MSIRVPTARLGLSLSTWLRTTPIMSGEHTDDEAYGYRGINSEVNFAYANGFQFVGWWGETLKTDASSSGQQTLTESGPIEFGADIVAIHAWVYAIEGTIELSVNDGTSTLTDTVVCTTFGLYELEVTLGVTTGATGWWQIKYTRTGGQTFHLYGLAVGELRMVAADFP